MSGFRSTLVAAVCLAAALALWVTAQRASEPALPPPLPVLVMAQNLAEVQIRQPDTSLDLVRGPSGWTVRGKGWVPSRRLTARIEHDLAELRPRALVTAEAGDLSRYGLGEGATTVTVLASDGPSVLEIGDPSPSGVSLYVRAPPLRAVYLVPLAQAEPYTWPPSAWREPRFAAFDPDLAVEIDARVGDRRVVIERHGDDWYLEAPERYRLEEERVRALLRRVAGARALAWLDASPADLGIDAASDRAFVRLSDGSTRTVRVGAPIAGADPPRRAAVHEESGAVVAVADGLLAPFAVDPSSWRVRDPVALYPWQVEALAVRRGTGFVRLARAEPGWATADGVALSGPLPDRLARAATELSAVGYHDDPPPDAPWAEVVVFGADAARTLLLGDARPDGRRYVWLDGDPTAYEVEDTLGPLVGELIPEENR